MKRCIMSVSIVTAGSEVNIKITQKPEETVERNDEQKHTQENPIENQEVTKDEEE